MGLKRKMRHVVLFLMHLLKLVFIPKTDVQKRILGIWDYKSLPWSIGDALVFVEKLSLLKILHNAEGVDICVVYDQEKPGGNRSGYISKENAQDNTMDTYLPLFTTSPYLENLYQFSSRNEFYRFLKMNIDRYEVFPSITDHLSESYNFVGGEPLHFTEVEEFYQRYSYIPHLKIGEKYRKYAREFYKANLKENAIPVTLSLRGKNVASYSDDPRNADPSVWLGFIKHCDKEYPQVTFVFIGYREEVLPGLTNMKNVVVAKKIEILFPRL